MLKFIEANDFLAVKLDPPKAVSEGGIFLTQAEAILNNEQVGRTGTVYAAPARYTTVRNRGEKSIPIIQDSPVKPGDRVLLNKFAGVMAVKDGDEQVYVIRFHEIEAVLEVANDA